MAVESAPWQAHALGGLIIVQEPLDLGTRGQGSADSPWHPLRPCGSETTFSVDQTATLAGCKAQVLSRYSWELQSFKVSRTALANTLATSHLQLLKDKAANIGVKTSLLRSQPRSPSRSDIIETWFLREIEEGKYEEVRFLRVKQPAFPPTLLQQNLVPHTR